MIFLSFYTTTHSIQGEAEAKKEGLDAALCPTPRRIGGSCSLSLRFGGENPEETGRAFFERMEVPCTLYRMEGEDVVGLASKGR